MLNPRFCDESRSDKQEHRTHSLRTCVLCVKKTYISFKKIDLSKSMIQSLEEIGKLPIQSGFIFLDRSWTDLDRFGRDQI